MSQQIINIGTAPNDGTGDDLRTAGGKINANFTELYTGLGTAGSGVSLAANLDLYVRADGNDSNPGNANTSAGAFLTIQKAVDTAYGFNLGPYQVTIHVNDGTYGSVNIFGPLLGTNSTPLTIKAVNAGLAITSTITVSNWAYVLLDGLKTQAAGEGWQVENYAHLQHKNCTFGDCTGGDMIVTLGYAHVEAVGPLTVSGNALNFCHCTYRSRISFSNQTINFNGNTFGTYLWGINDGVIALDSATITGARPSGNTLVHDNSLLNAYSIINAGGWGFLGTGTFIINDNSVVTADAYVARQLYVRSDATSDNNDGGENTVGRAFKTIQAAIDFITTKLPYNPANADPIGGWKISVADGTYSQLLKLHNHPYVYVTLEGDMTTPANCIIAGPSDAITAIGVSSQWIVQGFKLTAAAGSGIRAENGSVVQFQSINFGACSASHILAKNGASVICLGNYTISGASGFHAELYRGSRLTLDPTVASGGTITVTFSGTPAITYFLRAYDNSTMYHVGVTYSGSMTGTTYDVQGCSVNHRAGTTPGSAAGGTAYGGQVI